MQDLRKLKVWEKAHRAALAVYKVTKSFPKEELYGLTSQLRRAASSVPANIAEGCGRGGGAELRRYLRIAMGSASELEYHLVLSTDLGLLDEAISRTLIADVAEVKRMLSGFMGKLKTDH